MTAMSSVMTIADAVSAGHAMFKTVGAPDAHSRGLELVMVYSFRYNTDVVHAVRDAVVVPDADSKCIGLLVQSAMIQLHAAVVQVHTVDQLIVWPILFFGLQTHAAGLRTDKSVCQCVTVCGEHHTVSTDASQCAG